MSSLQQQEQAAFHTLAAIGLGVCVVGGYFLYQNFKTNPNLVPVETCKEGRIEAGEPSLVIVRVEYARILGEPDHYCLGTVSQEVAVPSYEGTPLTSQAFDFTYWRELVCSPHRHLLTCPKEP